MNTLKNALQTIFTFRWNPGLDLAAVVVSWFLVTGALYSATFLVTPEAGGGLPYFFMYAILTATLLGVGVPLFWMVGYRKRPVQDLGITRKNLGLSLILQLVFSVLLYTVTLARVALPPWQELVPLIALVLAIGFFEALFWRGWVFLRLEEAFGLIPALIAGSLLYAFYHIGYGMTMAEISFLFWIGVLFAVVFRLTRSIFILWPVFQPMGQLVTLIQEGLPLPLLAALGFIEVLVVMIALVWFANRYYHKHQARQTEPVVQLSTGG